MYQIWSMRSHRRITLANDNIRVETILYYRESDGNVSLLNSFSPIRLFQLGRRSTEPLKLPSFLLFRPVVRLVTWIRKYRSTTMIVKHSEIAWQVLDSNEGRCLILPEREDAIVNLDKIVVDLAYGQPTCSPFIHVAIHDGPRSRR